MPIPVKGTSLDEMWKRVLKVDTVSDEDNFFELGGHSLSALRLSIYIRNALELYVTLEHITKNPTFGELREFARTAVPDFDEEEQPA